MKYIYKIIVHLNNQTHIELHLKWPAIDFFNMYIKEYSELMRFI